MIIPRKKQETERENLGKKIIRRKFVNSVQESSKSTHMGQKRPKAEFSGNSEDSSGKIIRQRKKTSGAVQTKNSGGNFEILERPLS